jgi:hypothetical protein
MTFHVSAFGNHDYGFVLQYERHAHVVLARTSLVLGTWFFLDLKIERQQRGSGFFAVLIGRRLV